MTRCLKGKDAGRGKGDSGGRGGEPHRGGRQSGPEARLCAFANGCFSYPSLAPPVEPRPGALEQTGGALAGSGFPSSTHLELEVSPGYWPRTGFAQVSPWGPGGLRGPDLSLVTEGNFVTSQTPCVGLMAQAPPDRQAWWHSEGGSAWVATQPHSRAGFSFWINITLRTDFFPRVTAVYIVPSHWKLSINVIDILPHSAWKDCRKHPAFYQRRNQELMGCWGRGAD